MEAEVTLTEENVNFYTALQSVNLSEYKSLSDIVNIALERYSLILKHQLNINRDSDENLS